MGCLIHGNIVRSNVFASFVKQERDPYCVPACIQMLVGTQASQQDIYFRMLRIKQVITKKELASKSNFSDGLNCFVSWKEKECVLLEKLLNTFEVNGRKWNVSIARERFRRFPAFLHLKMKEQDKFGHMVIATFADNIKTRILDPLEDAEIETSISNVSTSLQNYYNIDFV